MATRVIVHQSVIAELVHKQGVKAEMDRRGGRVLDAAQGNAPVLSGEYRDNLHLEDWGNGGVRVVGGTDHDIYVEADTGNLARALDSAGGS